MPRVEAQARPRFSERFGKLALHQGEKHRVENLRKYVKENISPEQDKYRSLSDEALRGKTQEFRARLLGGVELNDILPEAFATVREAARRALSEVDPETGDIIKVIDPYEEQMMAGIVMSEGKIAEMATGEGKTLAATFAAYLRALETTEVEGGTQRGNVHVVTANNYLAQRDAELMRPVYEALGLKVGINLPNMSKGQKKEAYNCDITYSTANELGFDYLRDNMAIVPAEQVQRGFNFAIVDEADAVLIDEAQNPLILTEPGAEADERWLRECSKLVEKMDQRYEREVEENKNAEPAKPSTPYYEVDQIKRTISITEKGQRFVEDMLGIPEDQNLYSNENIRLVRFLTNAVKAKVFHKKDKDYIVTEEGKVVIVDEFTGRQFRDRQYKDGIHQAIEAKEGVEDITNESHTTATITLQNYFLLYGKGNLAGMTGTAATDAWEFNKIYKLGVVPIPPHKEKIRQDHEDVVYKNEKEKFHAIVDDILERHAKGQPVLVGTISVENSEILAEMLKMRAKKLGIEQGFNVNVLNAKNEAEEAKIIAQAGRKGAITIATNMAGRGTDILLGGNPEALAAQDTLEKLGETATETARAKATEQARKRAREEGMEAVKRRFPGNDLAEAGDDEVEQVFEEAFLAAHQAIYPVFYKAFYQGVYQPVYSDSLKQFRQQTDAEAEEVIEAGGLYVIGTERHDSKRIDNQLRGRAGRQGNPGESRFYVSFQDSMMKQYLGADYAASINHPDIVPIADERITRKIGETQAKIEENNRAGRLELVRYDGVLNTQREVTYGERQELLLLEENEVRHYVHDFIDEVVDRYIAEATPDYRADWDLDTLWQSLEGLHGSKRLTSEFIEKFGGDDRSGLQFETLRTEILDTMHTAYDNHMAVFTAELARVDHKPEAAVRGEVDETERLVLLKTLDMNWKEHLYEMEFLQGGIHNRAYFNPDPVVAYNNEGLKLLAQARDGYKKDAIKFLFELKVKDTIGSNFGELIVQTIADNFTNETLGKK